MLVGEVCVACVGKLRVAPSTAGRGAIVSAAKLEMVQGSNASLCNSGARLLKREKHKSGCSAYDKFHAVSVLRA